MPKCSSSLVPECPSALRVPKYPSAWVSKCTSALSACVLLVCPWNVFGVPIFFLFESLSAQVLLECPWSVFGVPNFLLSVLQARKSLQHYNKISLKTFQGTNFTWHFLLSPFLEIRFVSFASFCQLHVINHSKGFQKLSLNILQSFRKLNIMESEALFLVKL